MVLHISTATAFAHTVGLMQSTIAVFGNVGQTQIGTLAILQFLLVPWYPQYQVPVNLFDQDKILARLFDTITIT